MPIFYTLHNLSWGDKLTAGQRNCRTFLIGMCIYVVIWVILKNLQIGQGGNSKFNALFTGMLILFLADASVMAYLYKIQYGRFLTQEIIADPQKDDWKWDDKNKKYAPIPLEEKLQKELMETELREKFAIHERLLRENTIEMEKQIKRKYDNQKRIDEIIDNKQRLRAAVVLQRWWRKKLYEPKNGIIYKKTKNHFLELCDEYQPMKK